jgi:uncharacterized DUF497 family protein
LRVHHVARFPPRLGDAQPCDLEFAPPGDHALGGPLREPVANKLDVVSALEKHTLPAHIFCTPIAVPHFRGYIKKRREDHYDPAKRAATLSNRGLDFADAAEVFARVSTVAPDDRRDYGEPRFISAGYLRGRMVVIVWTRVRMRGTSSR